LSYIEEKNKILRNIVINGDKLKKYKPPYIQSIELYKEIKKYNNIVDWASDQKEYLTLLENFRNKKLNKK
jgi:hypothetical protein